jgi:Brp/Blh family beta-carotene 15,15'-monooxygenase
MFRTSSLFLISASILSTIFIGIGLISPSINESLSVWVLLVSVFLIGIPHGAIDHIVASELFNNKNNLRSHLIFYSSYLLIMALLGILWLVSPPAGMVVFLLISIYHFGQADMEDFFGETHPSLAWSVLRGSFIIGLILFSDPSKTLPIISDATGISFFYLLSILPDPGVLISGLLLLYFIAYGISAYNNTIQNPVVFFADAILLTTLFWITGPFIGFALYFAVWHSAGHIFEMIQFFKNRDKSFGLLDFIYQSIPFTVISLFGLVGLYYIQDLFGSEQQFITLMFIIISVLTLPHMFVVNKMYKSYN